MNNQVPSSTQLVATRHADEDDGGDVAVITDDLQHRLAFADGCVENRLADASPHTQIDVSSQEDVLGVERGRESSIHSDGSPTASIDARVAA